MAKNMYGKPNQNYIVLGNFKYTADLTGLIANVLDEHAPALQFQRCLDEDAWLKLQAAHPSAGLPAGGTVGQVVTKTLSGADWETPSGGGGSVLISSGSVHLTPTDMKAAGPKTIVAAPSAGQAIWAVNIFAEFKFNGIAYSAAGAGQLGLFFGDASGQPANVTLRSLVELTASSSRMDVFTINDFASDGVDGKALVADFAFGTPYDTGDGDVYITILYKIYPYH